METPGDTSPNAAQPGPLDLTEGTHSPWRVWLCNLGHLTNAANGGDISRVMLQIEQRATITLMLSRADGGNCTLELMRRIQQGGGHSYSVWLSAEV